jgi:hypothetical protein
MGKVKRDKRERELGWMTGRKVDRKGGYRERAHKIKFIFLEMKRT